MWRVAAPLVVLCVAATTLAPVSGCKQQDPVTTRPAPSSRPAAPLVAITGNEKGFIRPCGCSKPALGGIHRRAHALAELRHGGRSVEAISCGNLVTEGGRQQEVKLETFLLALADMNYAALVPGPGEFLLGLPVLRDMRMLAPFPWVLANVEATELGLVPSVRLESAGVTVVGLIGKLGLATGVKVKPAATSLAEMFPTLPKGRILVVFNGPDEEAAGIAAAIPVDRRHETDLLVPGHADAPGYLEPRNPATRIFVAGSKGRNIALWTPSLNKYEGLRLEESRPGTETMDALLDRYRTTVREELLATKIGRLPSVQKYVGDQRCIECHDDIHAKLKPTPHQRAFATLVDTKDEADPECAKCHVTGWGVESGYVDATTTPQHRDVNCESCHGPGSDHVEAMAKTPGGKVTTSSCQRCHDADNSPTFDFKKYWPKIEHK